MAELLSFMNGVRFRCTNIHQSKGIWRMGIKSIVVKNEKEFIVESGFRHSEWRTNLYIDGHNWHYGKGRDNAFVIASAKHLHSKNEQAILTLPEKEKSRRLAMELA